MQSEAEIAPTIQDLAEAKIALPLGQGGEDSNLAWAMGHRHSFLLFYQSGENEASLFQDFFLLLLLLISGRQETETPLNISVSGIKRHY